jgi:hypothetical protein
MLTLEKIAGFLGGHAIFFYAAVASEFTRLLLYWPQWGVRVALLYSFFAECGSLGGRH